VYKSCSRCGKIHDTKYQCSHNKPKYDNGKYKTNGADRLRYSAAWQKKAEEIKEASKYLCAVCKDKGIYTYNNLEVHHIVKLREAPDKLLENKNLICLCRHHHIQADNGYLKKNYLQKLVLDRYE